MFNRSVLRYAHNAGHTFCTYDSKGERIITCGSDGDMRTWTNVNDDDPTSQCFGEFINCLAQYDNRLLVASDLNTVQAYTFPQGEPDGTELRFTAMVTCIKVTDKWVAAGSEDTIIKMAPIGQPDEVFELTGHTGPILSIDINKNNNLVASGGGDGVLRFWDVETKKQVFSISDLTTAKSFEIADHFISPCFDPSGYKYMAYARKQQIVIFDTSSWSEHVILKHPYVKSDYTVCSYSSCGKYITAGTIDGDIITWEVKTRLHLKGEIGPEENYPITSIAWNPENSQILAFCDKNGQLGEISLETTDDDGDNLAAIMDGEEETNDGVNENYNFIPNDSEDEDNENCISLAKIKNETMPPEIDLTTGDHEIKNHKGPNRSRSPSPLSEYIPRSKRSQQNAFQPGSTVEVAGHRYLLWNDVGIVKSENTDHESSISVDFHDTAVHHSIYMKNLRNYDIAALSTTALALATNSTPSVLTCISLGAGSREWSTELGDCEEILAVGAGEKLVGIATTKRFLRIFSVMGTQKEVIRIPGNVLCTVGHKNRLLVAYYGPAGINGDEQDIQVILYDQFNYALNARTIQLPITPNTTLKWIGFSDNGNLVFHDSSGLICMYNKDAEIWFPICDVYNYMKNISDSFFITCVSEATQSIIGISCTGGRFPMDSRPITIELQMRFPVINEAVGNELCEKTEIEEYLARQTYFPSSSTNDNTFKEKAIKLFSLAIRNEIEARAVELIEMLSNRELTMLASKYTDRLGRIHLKEQLSKMLPHIEEQEQEREKRALIRKLNEDKVITNNLSLLLSKETEKSNELIPKPMPMNAKRLNPFKKSLGSSPKSVNPLGHLVNNTPPNKIQILEDITISADEIPCSLEPPTVSVKTKPTFFEWFQTNRAELTEQNPELETSELTKIGMNRYKELYSSKTTFDESVSLKRKLNGTEKKENDRTSKLAKFGFNKS